MAWMPVAEAAATLGVSERTMWRRIKAQTVPSRNENGRTLVALDDPDPNRDPVRQLSHVAAAQLSMRKLDADTVAELLAVVGEYRTSFETESARARRAARWSGAAAVLLMVLLFAGVWYHAASLYDLKTSHADDITQVKDGYAETVAELAEKTSRAEGLASAHAAEIDSLRRLDVQRHEELAAVESSRSSFQTAMDQRLAELQKTVAAQQKAADQHDRDVARLSATIDRLQAELQAKDAAHRAVRAQADRVTEAIRRSAARSVGLAEGLRLNHDRQQTEIRHLRRELADARHLLGEPEDRRVAPVEPLTPDALWRTVVGETGSSPAAAPPAATGWRARLRSWIRVWFFGPADPAAPREFARAE